MKHICLGLMLVSMTASSARAQLTGSVRTGYWSSTRDLDSDTSIGAGMFWLKSTRPLSPRVSYQFEGWANTDRRTEAREAYLDLRFGALDVRAGRQIIVWGRADGINPTDNLHSRDFTLLTPDEDDQRTGTTAVRASYYAGDLALTGIWLPEFRAHRFPGVAAPGGVDSWPNNQWAARIEQTGRTADWSLSYFDGFDPNPGQHRIRVIGADAAASAGRFGLRAEAAYVDTRHLFLVAGADRTFLEDLNVNVQYLHRYVLDSGVQHGASFRVAYKWFHDTLEAECAAAAWLEPHGYTIRPRIAYAVTDQWKLIAGGELFRGETANAFGLLGRNSTAYLEARWSF